MIDLSEVSYGEILDCIVDASLGRLSPYFQEYDVLLQCTDGLYRCLSDDAICQILNATKDLKQASKLLVETALTFPGAHDNTSVLLTKYKG